MEEFRKITGYENYSISNYGRVRNDITEKILSPRYNSNGYHIVSLYINGKYKNFKIHRLVGQAFIPNPNNKPFIDHIDGIRINNRVTNLRWCTNQENQMNRSIRKDSTSGVKGVTWDKKLNKWRVRIMINGKNAHIGLYETLEEAKAARQRVATENFGEFINSCERAPINIINIENLNINN